MKKTYNINVAGVPFIIDDDAYTLLNDYLKTIEHAFARAEDANELINDIESRVAELLLECTAEGSPIVSLTDVENVINRVGRPEEMLEEDITMTSTPDGEEVTAQERVTPPPFTPKAPFFSKKLFRDPQDAMLGGVCAGLAHYLKWDVTWVRILTILIAIGSVSIGCIAYLILWIVVPEAVTPLQRMQMLGQDPTMENIGKTVTDSFREEQGIKATSQEEIDRTNLSTYLNNGMGVVMKVLITIGMIIGIPVLIALLLGIVGCIFTLLMWGAARLSGSFSPFPVDAEPYIVFGVICGIGGCLVIAIPLYLLIRKGLSNHTNLRKPTKILLVALWIIGFLAAAVSAGWLSGMAQEDERRFHENWERTHVYEETIEDLTPYVTDTVPDLTDSLPIQTLAADSITANGV